MEPSPVLDELSEPDILEPSENRVRRPGSVDTLSALLDAFPAPVMILNPDRQIMEVNRRLQDFVPPDALECVGAKPGEILRCRQTLRSGRPCGETPACQMCGLYRAVSRSQARGATETEEFLLTTLDSEGREEAHEFRAVASPFGAEHTYSVLVLQDAADEKRRAVLERLFYHDLLNTTGAICGLLEIWDDSDSPADMRGALYKLASAVREQVETARDLAAAEGGNLRIAPRPVDAGQLISRLLATYELLPVAHGRNLRYSITDNPVLETDEMVLYRVLENLVKNALEASRNGETVMVSYSNRLRPVFAVHSQPPIPERVRCWIFQRSFSTKGAGRGVGLYGARLMVERYLQGNIDFATSEEGGTTFSVSLPATPSDRRP
jgi:signal transduction histidine kinase